MPTTKDTFLVGCDDEGIFLEDALIPHPNVGHIWLWSKHQRSFDWALSRYARPRLRRISPEIEKETIAAYIDWLNTPEGQPWLNQRHVIKDLSVDAVILFEDPTKTDPKVLLESRRRELTDRFTFFYHMTHKKNIDSICRYGLLSLNRLRHTNHRYTDISLVEAQEKRDRQEPVFNRPIHEYVPFYFNPKNPMQYLRKDLGNQLVLVEIDQSALVSCEFFVFSDGNAASYSTRFSDDILVVTDSVDALTADYWTDVPDGKRRRCAELLIHSHVSPVWIRRLICRDADTAEALDEHIGLPIAVDRTMFF